MSFLMRSGYLERLVPLRAVAALGDHRLEVDKGAVEQDFCGTGETSTLSVECALGPPA